MKAFWILAGCLLVVVVFFVLWFNISDYSDRVANGTYHFAQDGQTSVLVLKPDHSFQQELREHGEVRRATGSWHRVGEGGIEFSKEFLAVAGQEPHADGSASADMHKDFGFFVSLNLRQYYVQWYGRVDPSPSNTVSGTYVGDEPGISATLIVMPDHTFEQTLRTGSITNRAKGSWSVGQNGVDIIFSKDFLKPSGASIGSNETASAWDPKGADLQIQIATTSRSGVPIFRKKQLF
jgi:hypothetical protein